MYLKLLVAIMLISSFKIVVFASADFGPARVLPVGRHQMTLRFGEKSHLSEKYNDSGTLQSVGRMNVRLNKEFLISQSPKFNQLLKFVDKTYPHLKASQALDPGALGFTGDAAARYIVPQLARGVTKKWSFGVALPVVNYETTVRPQNLGTNTSSTFFETLSGDNAAFNPQIAQGEDLLNGGPISVFNQISDSKGYKRVEPKSDTFLADIILGSSYQVFETRRFQFYFLNFLTLPTGPKDDPDDLVDLNVFHKTSLKNSVYLDYRPTAWVEFGVGLSYTIQFDERTEKRVPTSESDFLPDFSTKEKLKKSPGDKVGLETAVIFTPVDRFEFGFGYDYEEKQNDSYSGSRGLRYDLLEANTETFSHIGRFKMSYTTLTSFVGGKSAIPYSISYAYADIFSGQNIEREQSHEMLLKFYF